MLESINGLVTGVDEGYILLAIGPLTLRLLTPGYYLRHISEGENVRLFLLFQIINEGNKGVPLAVAFPTISDRDFFKKFISVSGVGVRAAVKAMIIPPFELAGAIASGDLKILKSLPGIGNSRAKQIIAKLQDTMAKSGFTSSVAGISPAVSDARAILEQLGVPSAEASLMIKKAIEETGIEEISASALVRVAMRLRG